MGKKRNRRSKPSLTHTLQRAKKRALALVPKVRAPKLPALHLPHSSVFVAGVGIGLAVGLAAGIGFVWLGARHHAPQHSTDTAAVVPPKIVVVPAPAPAPAPVTTPPAYIEQTEPAPDDSTADDSGAIAQPPVSATPEPAPPPSVQESFAPPEPLPAAPAAPIEGQPAWLQNAVAYADPGTKPMIAIVLDDVGAAPSDAPGAVALPAQVTLSIMTYAPNAPRLAEQARKAGHEIMVHVPMEAVNRDADPGKNALLTSLSAQEIGQRLDWDLAQFQGYVGINNHMGSRFTQDAAGMQVVLQALKARGLLFLDSRTIASSVGDTMAGQLGVTHLKRDVFLDNVIDEADIRHELARAEAIAKKQGYAIAIGHPHPDTVEALKEWIPEAKARGFVLVPITAIAKKQLGVTG